MADMAIARLVRRMYEMSTSLLRARATGLNAALWRIVCGWRRVRTTIADEGAVAGAGRRA